MNETVGLATPQELKARKRPFPKPDKAHQAHLSIREGLYSLFIAMDTSGPALIGCQTLAG